ncbi:PQQ-dependent catabolism-associated CXXCW motif protein [Rhodovulum sp. ES.010]|uniref:PQQ-dependent catabolism-associated CXXCW motif protein n=1 Tax=Rhodovulum sp. ES.010 TaxID=1882821 RepID=UPI00092A04C0|nr:PQQ-dependent catabolism-associated CXXCW motif protein [Rhodovulum sp. ES.010]SIO47283.1 PQQ-dependent catabolism-associated CXXCW motif protein [Rhodovulum sp. ES.010]
MTARSAGLALLLALAQPAAAQVAEPEGYRMEDYRSPVPETLAGGTVVGPEEAHALWETGDVAFIDVNPRAPRPANLPEGTIWRDKPRYSIPGAIWLPNVGYGAIAEVTHAYFRAGLDKATGGDTAHPVLFFCLDDCWMSWNAAKRALEDGYTGVYWFPEGTDGWTFFDYPVERLEAEPDEPGAQ